MRQFADIDMQAVEPVDDTYVAPMGPYQVPRIFNRDEKSQLHTGTNRVTYIFIDKDQVVSIHFDSERHQLFYQGHNLGNLVLDDTIISHLYEMQSKLALDPRGRAFHAMYSLVLNDLLATSAERNV